MDPVSSGFRRAARAPRQTAVRGGASERCPVVTGVALPLAPPPLGLSVAASASCGAAGGQTECPHPAPEDT